MSHYRLLCFVVSHYGSLCPIVSHYSSLCLDVSHQQRNIKRPRRNRQWRKHFSAKELQPNKTKAIMFSTFKKAANRTSWRQLSNGHLYHTLYHMFFLALRPSLHITFRLKIFITWFCCSEIFITYHLQCLHSDDLILSSFLSFVCSFCLPFFLSTWINNQPCHHLRLCRHPHPHPYLHLHPHL